MRRAALLALVALAALPAGAGAATPRVETMVVGRSSVLLGPTEVSARAAKLRVGRRTCAVPAATPLAVLQAARGAGGPSFHVRDFGSCSRRTIDASGLFVDGIGPDRNAGSDGWVYKVGRRSGSTSAADPAGAFGNRRLLRSGQQVLWYWCVLSDSERCPPTLEVSVGSATVAAGAPVSVTVKAYDDDGRAQPVTAMVSVGAATATTDASGTAVLSAPGAAGAYPVVASAPGAVSGFPGSLVVQ